MKFLNKYCKGRLIEPYIYIDSEGNIIRDGSGTRKLWLSKLFFYTFTETSAIRMAKKITEPKYSQYSGSIYYN